MIESFNNPPRVNILGVGVSAINMAQALDFIDDRVKKREPHTIICLAPAHAIMGCLNAPALRSIYNHSGLTTPDGMSIVWLLRWYGYQQVNRVYGPDLLNAVCSRSQQNGYRHYFYGGEAQVVVKLVEKLKKQYLGLEVVGYYSPPFRKLTEDEEWFAFEQIRTAQPDIVWVGLGSPRQEHWMYNNLEHLKVPIMIGVGAAFDFLSGNKPWAPRWMQRFGLEWVFRLASEPKRLWRRYINYPLFIILVLLQKINLVHFPLE